MVADLTRADRSSSSEAAPLDDDDGEWVVQHNQDVLKERDETHRARLKDLQGFASKWRTTFAEASKEGAAALGEAATQEAAKAGATVRASAEGVGDAVQQALLGVLFGPVRKLA